MLTRRLGLTMASTLPFAARAAGAPTMLSPLAFMPPKGSVDTHVHVFPDPARFPFWAGRAYTPPTATADDLLALQAAEHMDHVVIVTPSVYATDNAATLDGIKQLGQERARGIAVIGPNTTPGELDLMQAGGVRGVRINLEQAGVFDPAVSAKRLADTVAQIAGRPWHIQIYSRLAVIAPLHDQLAQVPVPLVFDHFAGAQAALGAQQPGWDAVLDLVRSGRAYVKMSGAYRSSVAAPGFADVTPLAQSLVAANPDRLVWGSDWPHPGSAAVAGRKTTDLAPALAVDDGHLLNLLAIWVPDPAVRSRILVDNPHRLYGFS